MNGWTERRMKNRTQRLFPMLAYYLILENRRIAAVFIKLQTHIDFVTN